MRAYARDHNVDIVDVAHGLVDGTLNLEDDDSGPDEAVPMSYRNVLRSKRTEAGRCASTAPFLVRN
jgi:hypothetical protein